MASNGEVRLPGNTDRIAVVGRTGSGKTVGGMWHLSVRPLHRERWIVYDFKTDVLINSIEDAQHVELDWKPRKKDKGLFIVHPLPDEQQAIEKQMWSIWEAEKTGVFVDEGYMIDNPAFNALLTQGRSKRIPMIVLSQRPVWMPRFVFSEANFYQIFSLNDRRDEKTIQNFAPIDFLKRLPDFHSYYYDIGRAKLFTFSPVPGESEILKTFEKKLHRSKKFL